MKPVTKTILLLLFMLIAAGIAAKLTPMISLADEQQKINLKIMIPTVFGEWEEILNATSQIIDPQQNSTINKIYSETLNRTYINKTGYRIMLSIAYGKNQNDSMQLHKPEICYPAQGFTLLSQSKGKLEISGATGQTIPITRLTTSLGQRNEPITYWTTIGNKVVQGQFNKKMAEMSYAFNGRIPDGMLIRLSSIDSESSIAFVMQSQFAQAMIRAIDPVTRPQFAGKGWKD